MKMFKTQQQGFTLIEVLVSLLVLSIGLLGLAALQATSLKANHGAYNRGQAIFLAYDIMDRMRANRTEALAGNYNRNVGDGVPGAGGALSQQDLNDWLGNFVTQLLPNGDAAIACPPPVGGASTTTCTVTMQWDESRLGGNATDLGNNTQFIFTSQI